MINDLNVRQAITAINQAHIIMARLTRYGLFALCFSASVEATDLPHSAHYTGPVSAQHNDEFFARVKGQKIKRLLITSSGGEVEAGIALGRWVFLNQVDVIVEDYCLSSCANYVFPAARYKTIKPRAIVAWHGNYHHLLHTGLWREEVQSRMQRNSESSEQATKHVFTQVKQLVAMEKEFFRQIGVDEYLCWIGKQDPYNAPNYYFMSATDMARFGIDNIKLPSDYRDSDVSRFDMDIVFIRLTDKR
jgi:hypothetical protein